MFDQQWRTVVCVATGPSFGPAQDEILTNRPKHVGVIAVNDAFKFIPNADIIYASDPPWWRHNHVDAVRHGGQLWTCWPRCAELFPDIKLLPMDKTRQGLSPEPWHITFAGNTGNGAMQFAYHLAPTKCLLVGYDCQKTGGKKHRFGDHPGNLSQTHAYASWIHFAERLAADFKRLGFPVINCSTQTALTCFPRGDLATELA